MLTFRKLKADEIELRVGTVKEGSGFSLLLYKTARVDANLLDEVVGQENWQKRFYQVKNTMICSVGIYFENRKEWVWKDDAGDESNQDAIKGEASDAFKRAGFAWGIGRELYNSPFIWIKTDNDNNPKTSRYSVKTIDYKDNAISKLVIVNDKTGQVVFSFGSSEKVAQAPKTDTPKKPITEQDKYFISEYVGTLNGEVYNKFFQRLEFVYHVKDIGELTEEQGKQIVEKIINGK